MARPKGSLNRKTRRALYDAAQEYEDHGKAALTCLAKIMLDPQKDESIRMRAANILLPFVRPKLSAVEQTNIDPAIVEPIESLLASLREIGITILTSNQSSRRISPRTFLTLEMWVRTWVA